MIDRKIDQTKFLFAYGSVLECVRHRILSITKNTDAYHILVLAVREDRTPCGKHRHKRLHADSDGGGDYHTATVIVPHEPLDNTLLETLVNAKPDSYPSFESKYLYQPCNFRYCISSPKRTVRF